MSNFVFRRAVRENVPLLIGLAGGTGSGKTKSAMELAKGMTPAGKRFAVIDTEAGRALAYADDYEFDHGDLRAPFRPAAYLAAIQAADKAGYPVIIVDSMSHEHAGDGGLLDWHEDELARMAGDDWKRREAVNMAAWIKPKLAHKEMMTALLQIRAHLILCFRAEEKVSMEKRDGRTEIVPKQGPGGFRGWLPICEKNMPYELTASFLMLAETPGIPKPIKLNGDHRPFFPEGKLITAEAGRRLAEWARGGSASGSGQPGETRAEPGPRNPDRAPADTPAWQAAEAPAEPPESGMRDEAPGAYAWTTADLKPRLTAAALSMNDLRLALKVPAVTKDNFEQLINQYLDGAPNRTLDTLIADTQAAISAATDAPGLPLEAAPA